MAETKIVKINDTTWEVTPVTYADKLKAEDEGYLVPDYAWKTAKYRGLWVETNNVYWLSHSYKKDIEAIIERDKIDNQ